MNNLQMVEANGFVGIRIKLFLKEKGFKQQVLVDLLEISKHSVSMALRGERIFSYTEYQLICAWLNVPTNYFLDDQRENFEKVGNKMNAYPEREALREKINTTMETGNSSEFCFENDNEYFLTVGMIGMFFGRFVSQKMAKYYQSRLINAKSDKEIKDYLTMLFLKHSHEIAQGNQFDFLMSNIMSWGLDDQKIDSEAITIGILTSISISNQKRNKFREWQ